MENEIRPGDVVWDVGANVGHYTALFSHWVGPEGRVEAFEPAPAARAAINALGLANVTTHACALGRHAGTVDLHVGSGASSPTNSLVGRDGPTIPVRVVRGDDVPAPRPDYVKIDVEGFEEEVLLGMPQCLRRCGVFCEVHFALLEARGEQDAPKRIAHLLRRELGIVKWVTPSHISRYL